MDDVRVFVSDATSCECTKLNSLLQTGEVVRWATRPLVKLWCFIDTFNLLVSLLILAFMIFWLSRALENPHLADSWGNLGTKNTRAVVCSLPFFCIIAYLAASPWLRVYRLKRSLYIITSKRALVLERKLFSWKTQSWKLAKNMIISSDVAANNQGRLVFWQSYNQQTMLDLSYSQEGFLYLRDVFLAQKELRKAIEAKRMRPNRSSGNLI